METHVRAIVGGSVLALLLLLLGGGGLSAQAQGTISGEVRAIGTQRPLANAQVYVQGTSRGTLTNNAGQYILTGVPVGEAVVRVDLIGYGTARQTVAVTAGATATANFALNQSALELEEIVVTGAGTAQERRRLGNTISTVSMDELADAPVASMSEILGGREAGVMGLPGGGIAGEGSRIRIRGSSSISQSNEPVVYVDGVRVDNGGGLGPGIGAGGGGGTSRLDDINPESIERIEILKGAAAATLFGTEASNGVIQIFTKRGQSGAPQFNVSVEQSLSRFPASRLEGRELAGFVMAEEPTARPHGRDIGTRGVREFWGLDVRPFEVFEVDPFDEIFGTGHGQTYSLSLQGGTPALTYFFSGRLQKEDGPFDGSGLQAPGFHVANDLNEQRQFNASIETSPREDLQIRVASSYVENYQEVPENNNNTYSVFGTMEWSRPELANENNLFGSGSFATTREAFHRRTNQEVQRFGGSVKAVYTATPALSLDATVGIDLVNERATRVIPFGWNVDRFATADALGWRRASDRNHREATLDLKANWNRDFGDDWNSQLVVGAQGFLTRTQSQYGTGQQFAGPGLDVAGAGAIQSTFESFLEEVQLGFLAQHQTGWRDFVFATVGARYDQHSAFGETAGGALYPKASLSVIPSQLGGWNRDRISTFRLRGAIGTSGLQPGAFDQFTTFSPLAAETGPGVQPGNLGNPDLKPETSLEWEVGAEVGFWADRAALEVTYWDRAVTDLLVNRQFAPSGGFRATQVSNIGRMDAHGVDISATVVAVARPNFSLNVFANGAFLRERITDMGDAPALKVGGTYPRYRQFVMEGFHPGAFFGAKLDESVAFPIHRGTCQAMTEAELRSFFSVPQNPSSFQPLVVECSSPQRLLQYLGKPVPDWQGAFGADATLWGNFSVKSLFEYRAGDFWAHDLGGSFRSSNRTIGRNLRHSAELESILLNPASTVDQRLAAANEWVCEVRVMSPYDGLHEIERADFLRFRELSLTYRAPTVWAERLGARNLSITLGARNLALWTKYSGIDPEANTISTGSSGVDGNFLEGTSMYVVPLPRRFSIAIQTGF